MSRRSADHWVMCSDCSGSGEGPSDGTICHTCRGDGELAMTRQEMEELEIELAERVDE